MDRPLEALLEIAAMDVNRLATLLKATPLDAFAMKRQAAVVLLPYLAKRV